MIQLIKGRADANVEPADLSSGHVSLWKVEANRCNEMEGLPPRPPGVAYLISVRMASPFPSPKPTEGTNAFQMKCSQIRSADTYLCL
jgi:hypothetical protein